MFFHLFRAQSYAEVQPDFTEGNVSANRMQSDESWLSRAMLRCSLTSRQQCQCKPNAELENSFSKVMLRCSLTSRQQCQCKPNAERRELALKSYAEVQPDFATAKIQHEYPVLQIFSLPNIAPRKFATPSNRHSAIYLRAFLRIFHTRKKMKSGYK